VNTLQYQHAAEITAILGVLLNYGMEEGRPLDTVRSWVAGVRQRLRLPSSEEADADWLIAGGPCDQQDMIEDGMEIDGLLLDDHDQNTQFGPLQLEAKSETSSLSEKEFRPRLMSSPETFYSAKDGSIIEQTSVLIHDSDDDFDDDFSDDDSSDVTLSEYDVISEDSTLPDELFSDDSCSNAELDNVAVAVARIMQSLNLKQQSVLDFLQLYGGWRDKRALTMHTLLSLADDLEHHRLNVNISVVTGSSVGATGGILAIVGLALAPETFGVSLILTAVGTAASVAGGVTSLGSNIADCVIAKKRMKLAQEAIDEDVKYTKDMHILIRKLARSTDRIHTTMARLPSLNNTALQHGDNSLALTSHELEELQDMIKNMKQQQVDDNLDTVKLAASCAQATAAEVGSVGALSQGITRAVATAAEETSVGLSVAARAAGITFSALAVGLDVYKIITTSVELAGGSPSEGATKLRRVAADLQDESHRMDDFHELLSKHNDHDDTSSTGTGCLSWDWRTRFNLLDDEDSEDSDLESEFDESHYSSSCYKESTSSSRRESTDRPSHPTPLTSLLKISQDMADYNNSDEESSQGSRGSVCRTDTKDKIFDMLRNDNDNESHKLDNTHYDNNNSKYAKETEHDTSCDTVTDSLPDNYGSMLKDPLHGEVYYRLTQPPSYESSLS